MSEKKKPINQVLSDSKNLKSLLSDLEKLGKIFDQGKMYSREPNNIVDKIERIYCLFEDNPVFDRVLVYEDFEILYDVLGEYLEDRFEYQNAYYAFENRENDSEWGDYYYDGFDEYDDGPQEIEDNSAIIEEVLYGSMYDVSQLLSELEMVKKLKLPEDIIRTFVKPAIF